MLDNSLEFSTVQLCRITGLSYRQMDYYARTRDTKTPGSGHTRKFSLLEAYTITWIEELQAILPRAGFSYNPSLIYTLAN